MIEPRSIFRSTTEIALSIFYLLLAYIVISGTLAVITGSPFYAGVIGALCIAVIVWTIDVVQSRTTSRVLLHVEGAIRVNSPVPEYLRSVSGSESRAANRQIMNLVRLLEQGNTLSAAIAESCRNLSFREVRLIMIGERTNRLEMMLRRIVADRGAYPRYHMSGVGMLRWYLPMMVLATLTMAAIITVFVMPKFEHIMKDFGVQPEGFWLFAFRFPRLLIGEWLWVPALIIGIVALISGARQARDLFRPRHPLVVPLRRMLTSMPGLKSLGTHRGLADICTSMAADTRAGLPLPQSVEMIGMLPLEGDLPQKVSLWRRQIDAGDDAATAARSAGLPGLLACVLRSPGTGLPDTLDSLALFYEGRYARLKATFDAMLVPLVTLLAASAVLMMSLSIFLPMLHMTEAVLKAGAK